MNLYESVEALPYILDNRGSHGHSERTQTIEINIKFSKDEGPDL